MSMVSPRPDLIVGVDLGQTCTGVAYSLPRGGDNVRPIQRWPGAAARNENKVPTVLGYPHGSDRPSWGFRAEPQSEKQDDVVVREWFKTLLDPRNIEKHRLANPDDVIEHEDVRRWYRDFLSLLYDHIKQTLKAALPNFEWSGATVEFLFSMPTTWPPHVVETFREIIGQAGFAGPLNASHSVTMSLTEAEAAAVHTSTEMAGVFKTGDILVVCDAGGGTTDLSALEVTELMVGSLSLKQVDVVGGDNIGSAAIDDAFEKLVRRKLAAANVNESLGIDIDNAAWEMCRSRDFQNIKCEHGGIYDTPQFSIHVPGLSSHYLNKDARIENGEMRFNKDELQDVFENQVKRMFSLIDKQLDSLTNKNPDIQINHLVLSGGFGQSAFVQRRLKEHYRLDQQHPNAENMVVRVAPEPQMAVCKGLVADRIRKLKAGQSVLGWRCCRASYGLLCSEEYKKKNPDHYQRDKIIDKASGMTLVKDCVEWLVKKGEPVTIDQPIVHRFERYVKRGDARKKFPSKVVVSYSERDLLPHRLQSGVDVLCEFEADLSLVDERRFVEKKKHIWRPGDSYLIVEYEVRVIIGPADLQFELWFEGSKMSKENSIKVEWGTPTDRSTAALVPVGKLEGASVRVQQRANRKMNFSKLFRRDSDEK